MRVKVPLKKGGKSKYAAIILSVSGNSVRLRFVDDGEVDDYDFAKLERIYDDDDLVGSGDEMGEEGETGDVNEEYDLGSEPSGDDFESDSEFDTDDEDECILSKNKEKGIVKKLKGVISGGTKKMKDILPNIKKGSKKKSKPNGNGKDLCYSCASRSMCNANHLIACFFAVEHQKEAVRAPKKQSVANKAKTSKNQSTLKSWMSTKKNEEPPAATASSSSFTTTSRNPTNGKVCIIFGSTI